MSWIGIVSVVVFSGVLFFVLGVLAGTQVGQHWTGGEGSNGFGESVELWKSVVMRIDELARRNVVELGAIRERLIDMGRTMSDSRVIGVIDELIVDNRRLGQQIHRVRSQQASQPAAGTMASAACSQIVEQMAAFASTGTAQAQRPQEPAGDPLTRIQNAVDEERPLFDVLDCMYDELRAVLPFQRLGYAEVDEEADRVDAVWYRSDRPVRLKPGYSAALSKSSLQFVARQNRPRVLNNLPEYLRRHPGSSSTRLIVEEGFRSSLTCPLSVADTVLGFLFFTSVEADGFDDEHVNVARKISAQLVQAVVAAREQATA